MEEIMQQKKEDYDELLLMHKSAHAAREVSQRELKRSQDEAAVQRKKFNEVLTQKRKQLKRNQLLKEQSELEGFFILFFFFLLNFNYLSNLK
jgi:hypothetical protein